MMNSSTMLRFLLSTIVGILSACSSTPPRLETLTAGRTDIAFVSASPSLDQTLNRSEGFSVRLKYFLAGSGDDAYYIVPQFDTFVPGQTTSGVSDKESKRFPRLRERAGEVDLFVPLPEVLLNAKVSRPYRLRFYLVRATGEATSSIEATTRVYELKVAAP